jgi:hypothetical protein
VRAIELDPYALNKTVQNEIHVNKGIGINDSTMDITESGR